MPSSFSHISGIRFGDKGLGRSLGQIVRMGQASEFDGDGDGFLTGPDGEDNIPAPAEALVDDAADGVLGLFKSARADLESRHGDLSNPDNVRRAFASVFPNLKSLKLHGAESGSLSPMHVNQVVSTLHRGESDPDTAQVISRVSFDGSHLPRGLLGRKKKFVAVCTWESNERGEMEMGIDFNPSFDSAPGARFFSSGAWADDLAAEMRAGGASADDVNSAWMHAITSHEWAHAEHFKSVSRMMGIGEGGEHPVYGWGRALGLDKAAVEAEIERMPSFRKLGEGADPASVLNTARSEWMVSRAKECMAEMEKSGFDHLSEAEKQMVGKEFASGISDYAGSHFFELVAEHRSLSYLGYDTPSNAAWAKLSNWLDSKADVVDTTTNISPFSLSCSGFGGVPEGQPLSGKALGPKISRVRRGGKPSEVDGDGDGFVTGVDGEDNIPAPKAVVEKLTSLDNLRSWLEGRGESGFSEDDLKVFNLNVNSAEFERNRGRQRVANVLRDRWFYLERDSVRPQDEQSFDDLVEQEQERQRWLIGRMVDRAERVGDLDGLKDDIESRNILKDLLASDAALKELKDSESDFRKFDDRMDEFKVARKQRVDEIRAAATIVGDDVKREAERRVDAVLAGRKNILRDYVVARYGKSNAPWLKMTDAKRRELARFADEGDRESRNQLLDWADAMFSHDLIQGTNGKNYRVEVAETEYYDGEIRVSFQVFQEGSDRRVGYGFRRMSFIDSDVPEFENEEFFMDDGHKNAGIGTIINQHAFMYAKAAGFDSVSVKAARDGVFVWGKTGFREKIDKFKLKKMSKEVDAFYSGEKSIITNADDAAIILDLIEQAEKSVSRSETPRHLDFIVALSNVFPKDSDEYKKRNQEIAGWFIDNMPFSEGNFYFDENGVVADPRVVSDNKTKSLSFLDLSSLRLVKGLGPTIGGKPRVGKPSEVDGDGDGFVTGADGEDNVPAPLPKIFEKWKNASRNTLEGWFNERTNEDGIGFSDSDLADIGISREDFDNFVERGRKDADRILEQAREIVSAPPYGIPDAKVNRQTVSDMRMRVWQILSRREKKTIDQHSFFVEKNPESARQTQEEVQKFQAEFLQFFQAYGAAMRVREQQDEWNDLEKRLLKTIRDLQDKESADAENVLANLDPKIRAEADRRVKNMIEKRARLFGKYILGRYGEDDSPWLDMTAERRIQLAKAARDGDADAKRELENWARDMYSHDEIVGANGEKYRITAQADYSINSDDLTVTTKIWHVDSNGDEKQIGKSDRVLISMSRDVPQLYNSTLFIEEEEHKGQGIAGIYNSHAFMYAKAAGFTRADTSAADDGPYVWARLGYRGDISQENIDTIKDHLREFDEGDGDGDLIRNKEDAEIIRYLIAKWVKNNKGKDSPRHIDFMMALSNTERHGSMAWDRRQNQIKNFFLDEFPFDSGVFVFDENMILSDPRKLINETSQKALNILAGFGLISTKALGSTLGRARRIGQVSEVDGDGDGFITGPDGEDNVPAPKQLARKYVAPNMTEVFRHANYLFNNELSYDEQDSISDYVEFGYGDINGYFRHGSRDEDTVKVAKTFDDAFNKASMVLGNDETVYRGMSLSEDSKTRRWIQTLEVGDEFKDMGFVSTSTEKSQADIFANIGEITSVMFVITTPKGTEVMVGKNEESEIILRRGSQFIVTNIDKAVRNGKERYRIEMELLP